jgi:hypothetical protein
MLPLTAGTGGRGAETVDCRGGAEIAAKHAEKQIEYAAEELSHHVI